MTEISEDDIRTRAYALWEAAGCPEGSQDEHWLEALRQLTQEAETAATAIPQEIDKTSKLSVVKNDTIEQVPKKRTKIA